MTQAARTAARVLRVDAGLDGAIALLFVVLAATPPTDDWARPVWLAAPILLVTAAVPAALAAGLLVLSRRPDEGVLRSLGAGNGASALAVALWAVIDAGFGPALRAVLLIVAALLAAIATAQIRVARLGTGSTGGHPQVG
jgi:hypothetical protein